jgi:hypothetical protein
MPIWIVAHSETLCNFLIPLLTGFSAAQQQHALNVIEALLVCPAKHKTLAALTRLLWGPHADEYALADFFRRSPWSGAAVQQAVTRFLLGFIGQVQVVTGWQLLFLSIDDSLCCKDVATHALEAVRLHHDHVAPRQQVGCYTNSSRYISVHLQFGPVQLPVSWRLYLKRSQVAELNRARRGTDQPRLKFISLPDLAKAMLAELAPHLPAGLRVYVLFDHWYDGRPLQRFIRAHGWHFICAAHANRRVGDFYLSEWWQHLGHQRCETITLRSATRKHTYHTRHTVGALRAQHGDVLAIISKRDRRGANPAYFVCSDPKLSVTSALKYYSYRWQAEVDNWWLKERFGLADYRLQSFEAIRNWHALVFAAFAFIQYRRALPLLDQPQAALATTAETLAEHQRVHARQTVSAIAKLVQAGQSIDQILNQLWPP